MKVTTDTIMKLKPCEEYTEERVSELLELGLQCALEKIPLTHATWVLSRLLNAENRALWARQCASLVVHLWEPPSIVLDFLNSGDISIAKDAARAAKAYADYPAADAAAYAADAAAYAAYAADAAHAAHAAYAAYAAYAADAADATAAAAAATDAADAARRQKQIEIIQLAVTLIERQP